MDMNSISCSQVIFIEAKYYISMAKIIELESGKSTILVESADVSFDGSLVQASGIWFEYFWRRKFIRCKSNRRGNH
jgi:hypothetical protein